MKTDSDIKRDVEFELKWDPDIDATDIAVSAKNGVVTLKGDIDTSSRRAEVERVAAAVPHVQQVVNEIQVKVQRATSSSADRSR